jgi:hypothetical protein
MQGHTASRGLGPAPCLTTRQPVPARAAGEAARGPRPGPTRLATRVTRPMQSLPTAGGNSSAAKEAQTARSFPSRSLSAMPCSGPPAVHCSPPTPLLWCTLYVPPAAHCSPPTPLPWCAIYVQPAAHCSASLARAAPLRAPRRATHARVLRGVHATGYMSKMLQAPKHPQPRCSGALYSPRRTTHAAPLLGCCQRPRQRAAWMPAGAEARHHQWTMSARRHERTMPFLRDGGADRARADP